MEKYYELVIDALVECVKDANVKENVLKEAQKQLEFGFDRMKIEGKPTEQISRLIEKISALRFDYE